MATFKLVNAVSGKTYRTGIEGVYNALGMAETYHLSTGQPIHLIDEQKGVIVFTVDKA